MLCLVRYLFVTNTSVIDCLGRFVPEMTYYVSSGTLNLTHITVCEVFVCLYRHVRDADDSERADASDDHAAVDAVDDLAASATITSTSSSSIRGDQR